MKKLNAIFRHDVEQPMLLRKSPGPSSGQLNTSAALASRFAEWVAKDGFDEIECTERHLPFIRDPEAKVFPNSGWNTAARMDVLVAFWFVEPELTPEFFERGSGFRFRP